MDPTGRRHRAVSSDRIKRAAETVKRLRPVYTPIIDFYEPIFIAQENLKSRIRLEPIQIPEDILSVKTKENLPLIGISEFVIDEEASGSLFREICRTAEAVNGDISVSVKALRKAIDSEKLNPDEIFSGLLNEEDIFFSKAAEKFNIDKKIIAIIAYNSIKPSLDLCAQQLSSYLNEDEPWDKGYCPICGSPPGLAVIQNEGARVLLCGFCQHQWAVRRLCCPFCDNMDSKTLHYFYHEEEKDYRVDVCDTCKKYIKTLDERNADRYIYLPLELVSTLHLDIKAQELGFESAIDLHLQI